MEIPFPRIKSFQTNFMSKLTILLIASICLIYSIPSQACGNEYYATASEMPMNRGQLELKDILNYKKTPFQFLTGVMVFGVIICKPGISNLAIK
jgi:hypothetical protein